MPELILATSPRRLLLICDHASNRVPDDYGALGLPAAEFERHIAWDIGAAAVTRRLAALTGAGAVLSTCSRLVIDCNRDPLAPDAMPALSDGTPVPANLALDSDERQQRVTRFHSPYHQTVEAVLDRLSQGGATPAVVSVHSFTPVMDGFVRPWHVGVLWNRDGRLAEPLIAALQADGDLCVGDNEPYSGRLVGYSMKRHGEGRGLPHVSVEIRQDLVADAAGADAWARRLARHLEPLLAACGIA